jgi:hypothetical protein
MFFSFHMWAAGTWTWTGRDRGQGRGRDIDKGRTLRTVSLSPLDVSTWFSKPGMYCLSTSVSRMSVSDTPIGDAADSDVWTLTQERDSPIHTHSHTHTHTHARTHTHAHAHRSYYSGRHLSTLKQPHGERHPASERYCLDISPPPTPSCPPSSQYSLAHSLLPLSVSVSPLSLSLSYSSLSMNIGNPRRITYMLIGFHGHGVGQC